MNSYNFTATKGRNITLVKAYNVASILKLRFDYIRYGWNVSETVNPNNRVILKGAINNVSK